MDYHGVPPGDFFYRNRRHIKGGLAVLALLLFFLIYIFVPSAKSAIDVPFKIMVRGLTAGYSTVSTKIYRTTGLNLGLTRPKTDVDFLFRVQVATYINARKAQPLLDIAMDVRAPLERREAAIHALEKFDQNAQWIRPFLNELFKGGLLDLDKQSPVVDELIDQIRAGGGVQNPLVRAYAEVVFDFMLQANDPYVRKRSLQWISDVMAGDAIYLVVPRFSWETDPEIQSEIENALYNLNAVSDRARARELLRPYFAKPPWPNLKRPIGVVLARLGYSNAHVYLRKLNERKDLTQTEQIHIRVALAGTRYRKEMRPAPRLQINMAKRKAARTAQYRFALKRQQEIDAEILIAKKEEEQRLAQAAQEEKRREAEAKQKENQRLAKLEAEQKAEARRKANEEKMVERKRREPPLPPKETQMVEIPKTEVESPSLSVEKTQDNTTPEPTIAETVSPPKAEPTAPEPDLVESEQVAMVTPEIKKTPPPPPSPPQASKVMSPVDIIFEVKNEIVPLYSDPGGAQETGEILEIGSKGKGDFEATVDGITWLNVSVKKKKGWIRKDTVSVFSLRPGDAQAAKPKKDMADETRSESTYFEAATDNVVIYDQPGDGKEVAKIKDGIPYLATKSAKVGPDRWFYLEIDKKTSGWVRGFDLILADVPQPAQIEEILDDEAPFLAEESKSAFEAEWIVAGVEGVLVYKEPHIAGDMVSQISPPKIYKVKQIEDGDWGEWYLIDLGGKSSGWVQSMDVNLTSPK